MTGMTGDVAGEKFEHVRHRWVEAALAARPQGSSLLDVGAGVTRKNGWQLSGEIRGNP
jgi:hypothetical protein